MPDTAVPRRDPQEVAHWLLDWLAERTGMPPASLGVDASLASLGLGSREAVELAADLSDWLGFEVSATAAWDHPTLGELAGELALETERRGHGAAHAGPPRDAAAGLARDAGDRDPIAIVGLACRFPGARDAGALWELLARGGDAIREVPRERWDLAEYFDTDQTVPGRMVTRYGGFIDDLDRFDAAAFGISGREATSMDPQQRLLLELSWDALADAGIAPRSLAGRAVGTFVGLATSDHGRLLLADATRVDAYAGTGNALSIAANRLAYALDVTGPSLVVDTACSSSLTAVHLACASLARGECELALAGGANVILDPAVTVGFSRAGFMAPDGRCRAFAARASGYVRSEGAGVVVLAPLKLARARGWPVRALIAGSAINQDGRSNGLTAPSRRSQEAVIAAAHAATGITGADVQYIEAHGTGTPLGDPIEALALGRVLARGRAPRDRALLGSIKTNIGHLEAAAGIAGLIKTVLSLERAEVPPSLHFDAPNPHIPFDDLPLAVVTKLTPWPATRGPRRAGVSAFGFGGANAHVVLEQAPADASRPGLDADRPPARVWQRERYWADLSPPRTATGGHPWLGRGIASSLHPGEHLFEVTLDPRRHAWLWDHRVGTTAVLPLAAHVELALAAVRASRPSGFTLAELVVVRALALRTDALALQVAVTKDRFAIAQSVAGSFQRLAEGRIDPVRELAGEPAKRGEATGAGRSPASVAGSPGEGATSGPAPNSDEPGESLPAVRERCSEDVPVGDFYRRLGELGLSYGQAFQRVVALRRGTGEAVADLAVRASDAGWGLHPATLDGALQALAGAAPDHMSPRVPTGAARIEWHGRGAAAHAHASLRTDGGVTTGRVVLYDASGVAIATLDGLRFQELAPTRTPRCYRRVGSEVPGGHAVEPFDVIIDARVQAPGRGATADDGVLDDARALALNTRVLGQLQSIRSGRVAVVARSDTATALGGLVATFAAERPAVRITLVDPGARDLAGHLDLPAGEDRLEWSGTAWRGARLEEVAAAAGGFQPALDPHGCYVITGGFGALGLHTARALAAGGARHLVLVGRSVRHDVLESLRAELTPRSSDDVRIDGHGPTIIGRALDVADARAVDAFIAELVAGVDPGAQTRPLRGVFHAAGVLADATFERQSADTFAAAFAPKLTGAWNLHRATRELALDHFVLFSSVAGVLGSPAQASYAAASAGLDALAEHRRALGLPALSIAWGPWAGSGMAADGGARLAAAGLTAIDPEAGRAALAAATRAGESCLVVIDADWPRLSARMARTPSLIADLATRASGTATLAARLSGVPAEVRHARLLAELTVQAAVVLGMRADELATDVPLIDLGLDSLVTLELQQWLERELERAVPGSAFVGNPTLSELAAGLLADAPASAADELDLVARVQLDPRVIPPRAPGQSAHERERAVPTHGRTEPARVFLTGASGYLGAYLLAELLGRSRVEVDCLVRGADAREGHARVERNLARYGLWRPEWAARVHAVMGDLAAPGLGLSARDWDAVAESADVVIHAGAWVNFAYAYNVLEAANVGGTSEVLRLATSGRARPVHHVSTLGMLLSTAHAPGARIDEDDENLPARGLANGYEQSKWVADRLVAAARARGVDATIHRVGLLAGESTTGRYLKRDDFFPAWIKGCIQLGCMPGLSTLTEMVPIDYVSRILVALALSPGEAPRTYHLTHPAPAPLSELARTIVQHGYPLELVPFDAWKARLAQALARGEANELGSHRHFVELLHEQQSVFPLLGSAHARAAAARLGVSCPPVTTLVARYLEHFRETGFLP